MWIAGILLGDDSYVCILMYVCCLLVLCVDQGWRCISWHLKWSLIPIVGCVMYVL